MKTVVNPDLAYSLLVRLCEDADHTMPGTEALLMDAFNLVAAHHTPAALIPLPQRTYDDALGDAHLVLTMLAATADDLAGRLRLDAATRLLGHVRTQRDEGRVR